ncbi:MAG: GrpB family protein [Candidatus Bathyarchaeota archaeon]|nr:GrpB family protein [Candidatus Bathyarchaeota archaeon]
MERLLGGKKDFVELHEIWLMTEYRGRDYGKKFFDFFEAFLKKRGHDSIVYYADHPAAITICRRRGCKEEEYLESIGEYVFYLSLRNTTKREIVIGDYDPQWPILYEKEREEILNVIGHIALEIEHMGSTAVQGLGAKPIIDIMVAVDHLSDTEKCIAPLRSIGYKYVPEYEEEIPERRFFNKGRPPKERHYHLHMVQKGSGFWKCHLLFRDYLRMHPNVAQQYYHLKKELASKYGVNREAYTSAKTSFIESIVAKAKRVRSKDKS